MNDVIYYLFVITRWSISWQLKKQLLLWGPLHTGQLKKTGWQAMHFTQCNFSKITAQCRCNQSLSQFVSCSFQLQDVFLITLSHVEKTLNLLRLKFFLLYLRLHLKNIVLYLWLRMKNLVLYLWLCMKNLVMYLWLRMKRCDRKRNPKSCF